MKHTELTKEIFKTNDITPEKEKEFIKELRLALRIDYEYPALLVSKMDHNTVIKAWYGEHELNPIGGK